MEQHTNITMEQIGLTTDKLAQLAHVLGHFPSHLEATLFSGVITNRFFLGVDWNELLNFNLVTVKGKEGSALLTQKVKSRDIIEHGQPEDLSQIAHQLVTKPEIAFFLKESKKSTRVLLLDNPINTGQNIIVWSDHELTEHPTQGIILTLAQACREMVLAGGIPEEGGILVVTNEQEKLAAQAALKSVMTADEIQLFGVKHVISYTVESDKNRIGVALIGNTGVHTKSVAKAFQTKGDLIFILGESPEDISGSVYLNAILGKKDAATPVFDVQKEVQLQGVMDGLIQQGLINSAHSCGRGGVYAALLALSLNANLGFDIVTDSEIREDAFLFGESPSRVIVTVSEDQEGDFIEFMMNSELSFTLLGHVTKGKLMVDEQHYGFVHEVAETLARAEKQ